VFCTRVGPGGGVAPGAVGRLFDAAGLAECFGAGEFVALKMHFGEPGNQDLWRPAQVREVVGRVRAAGGKPWLTDGNVLYRSPRHNAVDHLVTAHENGFTYAATGAPLIIADGLHGDNVVDLPLPGGAPGRRARIGAEIANTDAVICLTHVTGHIGFGLAGALKNLGMGSGAIAGKQRMHANFRPAPDEELCVACGVCARHCPVDAITVEEGAAARVDPAVCVGCAECVAHCPTGAIPIQWGETVGLQERTAEYCAAILQSRPGRFGFVSLLTGITELCDCMGTRGPAVCADIGVLASRDPVAIDQAALDLIAENGGMEKLRSACPGAAFGHALETAEGMGLGSRRYELVHA
jgi:uncharacterized Fe-S center protein